VAVADGVGYREPQEALGGLPAGWARLTARCPRPRFVGCEGAPGQGCAVQASNRVLCRVAVWHLNKAKTPRAAYVAVGHNPDRVDSPIWFEELVEVLVGSKYSNSPSYRRLRFYHHPPFGLSSAPLSPILSVKMGGKA